MGSKSVLTFFLLLLLIISVIDSASARRSTRRRRNKHLKGITQNEGNANATLAQPNPEPHQITFPGTTPDGDIPHSGKDVEEHLSRRNKTKKTKRRKSHKKIRRRRRKHHTSPLRLLTAVPEPAKSTTGSNSDSLEEALLTLGRSELRRRGHGHGHRKSKHHRRSSHRLRRSETFPKNINTDFSF